MLRQDEVLTTSVIFALYVARHVALKSFLLACDKPKSVLAAFLETGLVPDRLFLVRYRIFLF